MLTIYLNGLFYISFCFMFFTRYIGLDVVDGDFYMLYLMGKVSAFSISLVLILQSMLARKISVKSLLLLLLVAYIAFITRDFFILISFITILALRNINLERLLYIGFVLSLISIVYTIVMVLFKYAAYDMVDYILDERFGARLSLNYPHPNAFPYRFFIFLCFYVLVRKRISFIEMLILSSVSYLIYFYAGSRTSFFTSMLLLSIIYILQYVHFMKNYFIRIAVIYSFLMASVFSISSAIFFGDFEMLNIVNSFSSGRVFDSHRLFQEIGLSLLPRNISEIISTLNSPMDNFYNYTLASSGLVFILIFNIVTIKLLRIMCYYNLNKEVIIFGLIGVYAMLEKGMLDISLNMFLIYYAFLIYKEKVKLYKR